MLHNKSWSQSRSPKKQGLIILPLHLETCNPAWGSGHSAGRSLGHSLQFEFMSAERQSLWGACCLHASGV